MFRQDYVSQTVACWIPASLGFELQGSGCKMEMLEKERGTYRVHGRLICRPGYGIALPSGPLCTVHCNSKPYSNFFVRSLTLMWQRGCLWPFVISKEGLICWRFWVVSIVARHIYPQTHVQLVRPLHFSKTLRWLVCFLLFWQRSHNPIDQRLLATASFV